MKTKIKSSAIPENSIITHPVCFSNTVYLIWFYVFCYFNITDDNDKSDFVTKFDKFLKNTEVLVTFTF